MNPPTICWTHGKVKLIDQTQLPVRCSYIYCSDIRSLWRAIKQLKVRGAPALGVAAAFGVLLGINSFRSGDRGRFMKRLADVCDFIGSSRPTAVNLFQALDEMKRTAAAHPEKSVPELKDLLKKKAFEIYEEDRRVCRVMGDQGAKLIPDNAAVLTVCNAGALATVDYGTALGVFYSAKRMKKKFRVYACETRPLLQGARLTAWELMRARIDTTLICDNMAATLMKDGKIDAVFAGADRIAANGDTANKIGTYGLAVLARYHGVPFYIVAPRTTFDLNMKNGSRIPVEQRGREEIIRIGSRRIAPEKVKVFNPAFDVTGHRLITAFVTEEGILRPPFSKSIRGVFHGKKD